MKVSCAGLVLTLPFNRSDHGFCFPQERRLRRDWQSLESRRERRSYSKGNVILVSQITGLKKTLGSSLLA